MKKVMLVLLTLGLCLAVVGCGKKTTSETGLAGNLLSGTTIVIGSSPDYPPFESLDASGKPEGFEVDLLNSLLEIINKNEGTNLTITWKSMEFSTIITALQANQIDIGVSGFTYSSDRDCIFTTPHLNSKQVIITRGDTNITSPSDLVGKTVAVQAGTTGYEAAMEIEGIKVVTPTEYPTMFAALQAGQVDAVIADEGVGDHYVSEMNLVKCNEALLEEKMSIIIKTGNTALETVFNTALSEYLTSDAYQENLEKWDLVSSAVNK